MTQPGAMLNQRQQPAAAMLNQHPTTLDHQQNATTNTRCSVPNHQRSGNSPFRHSLVILSTGVVVFIGAALAAAIVAPLGWSAAALRRHRREDDGPSTSVDRQPALQVAASPQRTPNRTGARE